jgi:hypothetical protein
MSFKVPETFRVRRGPLATHDTAGNNGLFLIPGPRNQQLLVIASDGMGWEHVSVSLGKRSPYWDEMCAIKNLFWGPDDCVVQYHPAKSEYVNNHEYCLHLWRPVDGAGLPRPPCYLVGVVAP